VLAAEAPRDIDWLHAHFLHTPASVTRYAALMRGLPWSGSAHAKDIWTTPEWEKREKLAACEWLVTCTAANQRHLAALAPAGRVELVYHGVDLRRFPPAPPSAPRDPATILCVCRLVEKKGVEVLLDALARVRGGWRFVHVGGGPLAERMKRRAQALGIADRVVWRGAMTQEQVLEEYRRRRHLRAREPHRARRRSRRLAERACRGAEPGRRLRRDARLSDPRVGARRRHRGAGRGERRCRRWPTPSRI
jgi:glycosyltransferase involved in cell wall biosynthesis